MISLNFFSTVGVDLGLDRVLPKRIEEVVVGLVRGHLSEDPTKINMVVMDDGIVDAALLPLLVLLALKGITAQKRTVSILGVTEVGLNHVVDLAHRYQDLTSVLERVVIPITRV